MQPISTGIILRRNRIDAWQFQIIKPNNAALKTYFLYLAITFAFIVLACSCADNDVSASSSHHLILLSAAPPRVNIFHGAF